jgi:hypothetical protein
MKTEMTDEDYIQTQSTILMVARMIQTLPLEEFLKRINRSESIAPLIDPTLYMKASDNLGSIRKIAQSLTKSKGECTEPIAQLTAAAEKEKADV